MARKIFGTLVFRKGRGQVRVIADVASFAEFSRLVKANTGLPAVRDYTSESGNPIEMSVAKATPSTLFWAASIDKGDRQYKCWDVD